MPTEVAIRGSTVRDFQMLERNLLSHVRLAILISLLSSSLLLNARLPNPNRPPPVSAPPSNVAVAVAVIQVVAALTIIAAGIWEYQRSYDDLRQMRGFLLSTTIHFFAMVIIALIVFVTCIVYLVDSSI
ncbi:hypothetical protein BKA93DRAFT_823392 [Sparassis latifolia]|uniref:DUF202 domain-containing protein n=1 Tax=Sparassis crispa TaxID=139825 RepID=A0A401GWT9_9APHY|nr:hypothetical protein SCP_0905230 [Sparassis crispa]GBE86643.1 hypothetical protein SCP_0905230 [Sparassis crispa]